MKTSAESNRPPVPAFRGVTPPSRISVTLSAFVWDRLTDGADSLPTRINDILPRTQSFSSEDLLLQVLHFATKTFFKADTSNWANDITSGGLIADGVNIFLGRVKAQHGAHSAFHSTVSLWAPTGGAVSLLDFVGEQKATKKTWDGSMAVLLKRDDAGAADNVWSQMSQNFSYTVGSRKSQKSARGRVRTYSCCN